MGVDYDSVFEQKRKLDNCADELRYAKVSLQNHGEALHTVWHSGEMLGIQNALDRMDDSAGKLIGEMEDIGYTMIKACQELMEEDMAGEDSD